MDSTRAIIASQLGVLTNVCVLGAGLVYATIFSATRGNLGLMSWAFGLFVCALWIVMALQIANNTTNEPSNARPSVVLIGAIAAITAYAFIVAAFLVLLVSLFELRFTKTSQGHSGDSPLSFDVSPQRPAILAMVFVALTAVLCPLSIFITL